MKIVIDIPDDIYNAYKKWHKNSFIAQGTPYEERPQGEWLVVGHDDTTYWYRCSICEYTEHDNFTKHHHFCPSCGADMRGGKNDNRQDL